MNSLVSIIMPAYNCEEYIEESIKSVLNQSYKNIELIIINDGSKDSTEDIINRYTVLDKRLVYLYQDNKGPSVARNQGIDRAQGIYLMFIDSDDMVDQEYVEKLVYAIEKEDADIACCGYIDKSKYGTVKLNDFWKEKNILDKEEFLECVCSGVGGVLWGKIFKRHIIYENTLKLDPKIFMSEDLIFILEYSQYSQKFTAIDENLYFYNRLNENSISTNIDKSYINNYKILIGELNRLLNILNYDGNKIDVIKTLKVQTLVNKYVLNECYKVITTLNINEYCNSLKEILNDELIKEYKNKFVYKNEFEKLNNKLISNNKYIKILIINCITITLRKIKDIILRR